MATSKSAKKLEKWRDFFRTANSDIFDIIEQAIMVAASDCPKEFRVRRDGIAETLFSCKIVKCSGCDKVELALPVAAADDDDVENETGDENDDRDFKSDFDKNRNGCGEFEVVGGSKGNSSNRDDDHVEINLNPNPVSNYSYGEAEALTDELEEENLVFGEVMRIKEIFDNSHEESASALYDELRRLQLMALSVETLKATEIGKSVNALRKHTSKDIRNLARTLIEGWKVLVDEWVAATSVIPVNSEATPESMNPSTLDEEEGLPSPPLDDLAFFATQTTSLELSQFFDGMDDDGNPRNSGEFIKNRDKGRKPPPLEDTQNAPRWKQHPSSLPTTVPKEKAGERMKKQETPLKKESTPVKPSQPLISQSAPARMKLNGEEKARHNVAKVQQKTEKTAIPMRPLVSPQSAPKPRPGNAAAKLEASKRKLQESYQQIEKAKKQRTIQVMELHDLPKQSLGNKNAYIKPGSGTGNNHNRHWANGRR